MDKHNACIVLAAGGTGGHVFPAQALAHSLTEKAYRVVLFSDTRGDQFKSTGIDVVKIPSAQLHGAFIGKMKSGIKLMSGMALALSHLRRLKPKVVVGFGGYASFPTMVAALTLRLPTILHQADAYFGRTNRKLAPFATRLATSFPHVKNIPHSCLEKVSFTGLPVRPEIQGAPYVVSENDDPFHLLVTGGSQGARIFGERVPEAIHLLDLALQKRLCVTQQCRPEYRETAQALYERTKAKVELTPFIDNMGEHYNKAHFIVSRAGASSVVEVANVGRPAIFVPYPYAMDDHQFYNAQEAVSVGGGWMMREKDFSSKGLADLLKEVMTSPWKLVEAGVNIQTIGIPDAASRLASLVEQLIVYER